MNDHQTVIDPLGIVFDAGVKTIRRENSFCNASSAVPSILIPVAAAEGAVADWQPHLAGRQGAQGGLVGAEVAIVKPDVAHQLLMTFLIVNQQVGHIRRGQGLRCPFVEISCGQRVLQELAADCLGLVCTRHRRHAVSGWSGFCFRSANGFPYVTGSHD